MKSKTRLTLAIGGPIILGTLAVAIFLGNYFSRNKSIITIVNKTGFKIVEGQLRITSIKNEQETGPIENGDSAIVYFQNISDGEYVLSAKLQGGSGILDSGGYVTHGRDFFDRIVVVPKDGTYKIAVEQNLKK